MNTWVIAFAEDQTAAYTGADSREIIENPVTAVRQPVKRRLLTDSLELNPLVAQTISKPLVPEVNVYPNPTHGLIVIDYQGNRITRLILFDLLGNRIKDIETTYLPGKVLLNIVNLKPGHYFLKWQQNGSEQVHRVVKR